MQDFADGYLFGKLFYGSGLQPDFPRFDNSGTPEAKTSNFTRLQPTFIKLGLQFDARKAQSLAKREPGLALKVLYGIKQAFNEQHKNMLASYSAPLAMQSRTRSPDRGVLETTTFNSIKEPFNEANLQYFETLLRGKQPNVKKLMEGVHLKKFHNEALLQAQQAAEDKAIEEAALAAARTTYRNDLLDKMASGRGEKASRLAHDAAVHSTLLKHREELEKAELRIELVMAEKAKRKQLETKIQTTAQVNDEIDAFETNLKRFGTEGGGESLLATAGQFASPYEHMTRMQALAPQMAKTLEGARPAIQSRLWTLITLAFCLVIASANCWFLRRPWD